MIKLLEDTGDCTWKARGDEREASRGRNGRVIRHLSLLQQPQVSRNEECALLDVDDRNTYEGKEKEELNTNIKQKVNLKKN